MDYLNSLKIRFISTFIVGVFIGLIWTSAMGIAIIVGGPETNVLAKDDALNKKHEQALIISGKVTDVHDGDTVSVSVNREFHIRMLDCWAAEINSKDEKEKAKGLEAKNYLKSMVNVGDEVTIEIPLYEDFSKSLTFGRFLGYIWRDINGDGVKENISEEMVKNNYATKNKK